MNKIETNKSYRYKINYINQYGGYKYGTLSKEEKADKIEELLRSDFGEKLLKNNLITKKQAHTLRNHYYLKHLLSKNGYDLLKNKIITFNEIKNLPAPTYLETMLTDIGKKMLDNKLLDLKEVKEFSTVGMLKENINKKY